MRARANPRHLEIKGASVQVRPSLAGNKTWGSAVPFLPFRNKTWGSAVPFLPFRIKDQHAAFCSPPRKTNAAARFVLPFSFNSAVAVYSENFDAQDPVSDAKEVM